MKLIRVEHPRAWDQFVCDCPGAAYGHLFAWRKVIETAYGHNALYLAGIENHEIWALLPLIRIKRPFLGAEWVSIPFFDQAGILARNHDAGEQLLKLAGRLLKKGGAGFLSLRQDHRFDGRGIDIGGGFPDCFDEKLGMQIPLAPTRQAMIRGFRSKLRSQIQKGRKNGLTWEIGKARLLDSFYQVFSRNMRDLGSPVHSKFFFRTVMACFPANTFICVVYHRGRPAAASFMFRFKNRLANPWASSLREHRHLNTNMLLYWQMIGFACNLGMDRFDMGRSSRGAATHRFKQQWGPIESPLSWYTWTFDDKRRLNQTLSIPPWRHMPLWGANLAGPLVRKYISL